MRKSISGPHACWVFYLWAQEISCYVTLRFFVFYVGPMGFLQEKSVTPPLKIMVTQWLVGGLAPWNFEWLSIQLGMENHPNWRTHVFQRGRYTTNQIGCNGERNMWKKQSLIWQLDILENTLWSHKHICQFWLGLKIYPKKTHPPNVTPPIDGYDLPKHWQWGGGSSRQWRLAWSEGVWSDPMNLIWM